MVHRRGRAQGRARQSRPASRAACIRIVLPVDVDRRRCRSLRGVSARRARAASPRPHTLPGGENCRLNDHNGSVQQSGEEALVERARRGDLAAFEELVLAYQSLVFRMAFVIAGDATDAEEAAQDAFVKAHRALGRFRRGEPFRPWLLTIVANEARNRRRARGRRAGLALRVAAEPEAGGEDPEAAALATERRERLLAAVEGLRASDRDV